MSRNVLYQLAAVMPDNRSPLRTPSSPPFRFSAEFPNPRFLKEKKRVYSRTVSYAGSLWNIYIQKVRSAKNVQLGVYLHRAKEREADETVQGSGLSQQTTDLLIERIGQLEREMLMRSERRDRRRSARDRFNEMMGEEDTSGSGGDLDTSIVSPGPRNPLFSSSSLGRRRGANFPRPASTNISQFPLSNISGNASAANNEDESSSIMPFVPSASSDQGSDVSDDDDDADTAIYANPSLALARNAKPALLYQRCRLTSTVGLPSNVLQNLQSIKRWKDAEYLRKRT